MRHEEPLLFVNSPVIRKYIYKPVPEEESTSVFEMEHTRNVERRIEPPVLDDPVKEKLLVIPHIQQNLEYLDHPFRKELYQPIEVVTDVQVIKGKIHEVDHNLLWMKKDEELISVVISDIRDIKWKQQSFTL
ncbi:hypothetical protein ORD22_01315 [Sporosarcina sp. GW1-11]|uniref:hypothetical protein n=1 Tax=Sporosarcina sp. GW1-11 TaxID=2899126 RepID=UPI00294F8FE2|nr:hypothetical protein [Sporosarcina sp. GW1-11]MDV6376903.1 hypothetical protein [Sporosarcina sp. GW1-11]